MKTVVVIFSLICIEITLGFIVTPRYYTKLLNEKSLPFTGSKRKADIKKRSDYGRGDLEGRSVIKQNLESNDNIVNEQVVLSETAAEKNSTNERSYLFKNHLFKKPNQTMRSHFKQQNYFKLSEKYSKLFKDSLQLYPVGKTELYSILRNSNQENSDKGHNIKLYDGVYNYDKRPLKDTSPSKDDISHVQSHTKTGHSCSHMKFRNYEFDYNPEQLIDLSVLAMEDDFPDNNLEDKREGKFVTKNFDHPKIKLNSLESYGFKNKGRKTKMNLVKNKYPQTSLHHKHICNCDHHN